MVSISSCFAQLQCVHDPVSSGDEVQRSLEFKRIRAPNSPGLMGCQHEKHLDAVSWKSRTRTFMVFCQPHLKVTVLLALCHQISEMLV